MKEALREVTGTFTPTEEQRVKIRDTMLRSTYAFGKFVCNFADLDPDFHGMMAAWIEKPTQYKLGLAPRGHFKSTIWTIADKLRRATQNPEIQILILNEKEGNIIKWINIMQAIVMGPIYKWLFPEAVPNTLKVRWNSLQLELNRKNPKPQPSIEGMGITSALASNHYDIIQPDDLVGEEAYNSSIVMSAAVDKRKRFDSLLLNPAESQIHDVCTRWGAEDPAAWILKHISNLDFLHLSVWKSEGVPWFPRFFPPHVLEQMRVKYGPRDWALLYLNQIIGDGASVFDTNLLRNYTLTENAVGEPCIVLERKDGDRIVKISDTHRFQLIDAGLSPESPNARTANIVVALCPPVNSEPFDIVVLEARATKSGPADVLTKSHEVYERWDPMFASIEVFGGHVTFFHWLAETFPNMRIRKLPTDTKKSKDTRIREFYPFVEQGRVYVHRQTSTDLVDEMAAYPNGKTVDLLDALAYGPKVWLPPSAPSNKPKRPPGVTDFDLAEDMNEEDFIGEGGGEGRSPIFGY